MWHVWTKLGKRGAAGHRRFRRVPLDVNGTPDGRYADKRGAAVARGGCASRGDEVCSRRLVEQTVIGTVNSSRRMVLGGGSVGTESVYGVPSGTRVPSGTQVPYWVPDCPAPIP